MKFYRVRIFAYALALSIVPLTSFAQPERHVAKEEQNRALVVDFYNSFFNDHETEMSSRVIAEDYIQHNPLLPDGREPFVSYFTSYFKDNPNHKSEIVRSAADGDLVWLHVHSMSGEGDLGAAVVDIFRVENGMIVEHWDVIQSVPEEAANDNTMF